MPGNVGAVDGGIIGGGRGGVEKGERSLLWSSVTVGLKTQVGVRRGWRRGDCGQEQTWALCVFLNSPVLKGTFCFGMETEESENRFGRRAETYQISCP